MFEQRAKHIRCSEEKPGCANCAKSRLLCSGYDDAQSDQTLVAVYMDVEQFRRTFLSTPRPRSLFALSSVVKLGPDEYRALEFFQTQTLPAVCPIFHSELWERALLAAAHSVPAILYLILATSVYHQTLNSLGVNACRPLDRIELPNTMALRYYTAAVRLVRESAAAADPPMQIIKLACIMFTVLEFLRGNRAMTISHLLNGMNLLEDRRMSRQPDAFESEVESTLARLSLMQSLYGRPRSVLFPALQTVPVTTADWICTTPFANVQDARTAMLHLSSRVFLFVRKVESVQGSPQTTDILAEQESLRSQLLQWKNKLEELSGKADARAIGLLRVYHAIALIFLKTVITQYQTSFDLYIPVFRSAIETLETIIDGIMLASGGPIVFSLDLAIIPCLFYTAIKCRHPQLRRKAVSLLSKVPRREGLWDAREAALIAEHIIEFEERHMPEGELDGCYSIPEEARVQDVDIRETTESASLCIVLRWRPYAACKELEELFVSIKWPSS
ncbi:hypothetical protein OIDMADRAFT_48953 [Oidiodendron maius Zn]|uniref:Zn(2)-C6 fungal-type domain-containing protein n=1 Tax=Oidiodendron maius (strain Zn) TaxID=913774 RepID=A0A0C3DCR7_OIDMZ|nr:hypothetical protein OIDMADRAFT_48953 [Oidiodendron maius Zn]